MRHGGDMPCTSTKQYLGSPKNVFLWGMSCYYELSIHCKSKILKRMKHRGTMFIYCSNLDEMGQNLVRWKTLEMYESKRTMLFQPQKLTMPFGWFPPLLSVSGRRINESKANSSRSLCKGRNLTKFRGFENRTSAHFLYDALKFAAFYFRSKDAEPFGSNKKYLNIETSPLFWFCLQFSSILCIPATPDLAKKTTRIPHRVVKLAWKIRVESLLALRVPTFHLLPTISFLNS